MKNVLRFMAITAFLPVAVLAQGNLDEEVNAELDKMYGQQKSVSATQTAGTGATQAAQTVQVKPATVQTAQASQLPQATQVQVTVSQPQAMTQAAAVASVADQAAQKQPTTVIEAAPLTESNAEKLRKSRQDAELSTEQSIVEKLEKSRLEDEKRRAEVLFGDKFNTLAAPVQAPKAEVQPVETAVVIPAQTVAVAPVVVSTAEVKKEEKMDREAIRGEVTAVLSELKSKEDEKPKTTSYLGLLVGSGDYPDAVNVRGQGSIGVALGRKFEDRLVVEGSFLYSNYSVEQRDGSCMVDVYGQTQCYPRITEMNQYSTSGLVKYQLLDGMLRPEIGTLLSYTYRTFSDTQFALSDDSVSSQALDMGVMTGASLEITKSFALGLDFRYMWNLTNKVDSGFQKSYVQPYLKSEKPIERLNYYTMSISGKATF